VLNVAQTLDLVRRGDQETVALMLFPELGISAYATDDLLFQDALHRVEAASAHRAHFFRYLSSVRPCGTGGAYSIARWSHLSRRDHWGGTEVLSAKLSGVL
jgi:NAD+ synthase (glutamine-hydrolysing)